MALLSLAAACPAAADAWSVAIAEIGSPSGVTAWLVESHAQPVASIRFAFRGGSASEPLDKSGLSTVLADVLTDGATASGSDAFRRQAAQLSARISFSAGRDAIMGSIDAPSGNIEEVAKLVGAQIASTNFASGSVERAVGRSVAARGDASRDPAVSAEDAWYTAAFGNHPYATSPAGSEATLASITPGDLAHFKSRAMTRDLLTVAAAGDIDASRLGRVLDQLFGGLPPGGPRAAPADVRASAPAQVEVIDAEAPAAAVVFGLAAPERRAPGYMPALVLNEIMGGGGTASRLGQALRVRASLVYDIESRLIADRHASYLIGQFTTSATDVERAIGSLKNELERFVRDGATEAEVADAKGYLAGSFPLSFDSSPKIAANLLAIAEAGLGRDYPELRRRQIEKVSREDVNRIAGELLRPERLVIAVTRGAH